MFTYSDDYDILDIHGWNYYLMDDFLFLFYIVHGIWNGYDLHRLLTDISLPVICRLLTSRRLCWTLMANPFSMDDGCAMRKCGSWDVQWWSNDVTIVCCIHLHMGMRFDWWMHVSLFIQSNPACFTMNERCSDSK